MVEHAGGKAGFFQLPVAIAERADPAQVGIQRADRPAAEHDAGIRGVVGDGVENLSRRFGLRVDPFDAGVQNFQRRHHEVGGIEHVEHRAVRARQPLLHDEGEFGLDARGDKAVGRHQAAIGKEHVVEQDAGIRLVDIERALHRLRGQADLVALDGAARRDLHLDPGLLDRVGSSMVMPGCSSDICRICVRVFSAWSSRSAALRISSLERAMGRSEERGCREMINMLNVFGQTELLLAAAQT